MVITTSKALFVCWLSIEGARAACNFDVLFDEPGEFIALATGEAASDNAVAATAFSEFLLAMSVIGGSVNPYYGGLVVYFADIKTCCEHQLIDRT